MPNPTYNRLDDDGLLYLLQLLKPEIEAAGDKNVIEVIKSPNGTKFAISVDNSGNLSTTAL